MNEIEVEFRSDHMPLRVTILTPNVPHVGDTVDILYRATGCEEMVELYGKVKQVIWRYRSNKTSATIYTT